MARILTVRKTAWVKRRKPNVIRGTALTAPAVVELKYDRNLQWLVNRMCGIWEKAIADFFSSEHAEEYFATDASVSSQARILQNALLKKVNGMFDLHATPMAEAAVNAADKASSGSLHASLQQLSGGLSLPTSSLGGDLTDIWKASIAENATLIKSIGQQYMTQVSTALQRSITTGNGLQDLIPLLEKQKGITQRRAKMIATDQTRKAYATLNKARMEKVGLKKFEWLHTGGSAHPRQLHKEYSGKIFAFDDLPVIDENTGERGIPGQAINCRCRMVPVLDFEDED